MGIGNIQSVSEGQILVDRVGHGERLVTNDSALRKFFASCRRQGLGGAATCGSPTLDVRNSVARAAPRLTLAATVIAYGILLKAVPFGGSP